MNKIGIIGAMELEVDTLKAHMSVTGQTTRAGMIFSRVRWGRPKWW